MARGARPRPFAESRRSEIFELMCEYAIDHSTLPCKFSIYNVLIRPALGLSCTAYRNHFDRLVREGYVEVDWRTGAVAIVASDLTIHREAIPL